MGLSSDLISQFVKATNDSIKREKETIIAYGTTVVREGTIYVKLDGSDLLTPVTSTVNVRNNDRVTVMIKNHTATVTGNITSPSAGTEDIADAGKTATDYMTVTDAHGLVIGSKPDGILRGNIQIKSELSGALISLRDGNTILSKFSSTKKTFDGITAASTINDTVTITTEDEDGSSVNETFADSSQIISGAKTQLVVKIDSANPIYFSNGLMTDKIIITDDDFISNTDITLNGCIFDKEGRSVIETATSNGNLSIGYGRYKAATTTSTDYSTLYGNRVRLYTKNGASIIHNGIVALETLNSKGNMVIGYHLKKMGVGDLSLYAGDNVSIYSKGTNIIDSTGNAAFQAKNNNGVTTLGYSRYLNGGNTNIYAGETLNLYTADGGTITANSAIVPVSNAALSLGKYNELGWSNIYIGNTNETYNGLRMILNGTSLNLCGRDANGRFVFGNDSDTMFFVAKNVDTTVNGTAFKFTSGNNDTASNTSSVWLFGEADATSRHIGSYLVYNRTYSSAANMYVTQNGVFGRATSSSQRYKRDIALADVNDVKGLYDLPVKKFKYKNDYLALDDELYDKYLYGFIVEDLEDVLPCAVQHKNEDGTTLPEMWNSNIIVPSLLKLIQDLNNRLKVIEKGV